MHPDWIALLSAFIAADVRFLVVGAAAVAWHGHLRSTADFDVWVQPVPENAQRVRRALIAFGSPAEHLDGFDFIQPGGFLQLGVPPVRIDVLTALAGLEFDRAWERRQTGVVEGMLLNFPCLDDVIRNKRATGRDKDLLDVRALEQIKRTLRGR